MAVQKNSVECGRCSSSLNRNAISPEAVIKADRQSSRNSIWIASNLYPFLWIHNKPQYRMPHLKEYPLDVIQCPTWENLNMRICISYLNGQLFDFADFPKFNHQLVEATAKFRSSIRLQIWQSLSSCWNFYFHTNPVSSPCRAYPTYELRSTKLTQRNLLQSLHNLRNLLQNLHNL